MSNNENLESLENSASRQGLTYGQLQQMETNRLLRGNAISARTRNPDDWYEKWLEKYGSAVSKKERKTACM